MNRNLQVDIISDIHFEKDDIRDISSLLPCKSNILIVAGDVTRIASNWTDLVSFIAVAAQNYEHIIYVIGNHELYVADVKISSTYLITQLRLLEKKFKQLIVLNSETVTFEAEKVVIYGDIFMSHVKDRELNIPISVNGKQFITPKEWNKMHHKAKEGLETVIEYCENNNYRLIVVCHYSPVFNESLDPKYYYHANNDLYCTDLSQYFPYVSSWIFGHTGYNCDVEIDGCRILSNQYRTKTGVQYIKNSFDV